MQIAIIVLLVILILLVIGVFVYYQKNKNNSYTTEAFLVDNNKLQRESATNISNITNQMNNIQSIFAGMNENIKDIKSNASGIPYIKDSSAKINELLIGTKTKGIIGENIIGEYLRQAFGNFNILHEQYQLENGGRVDFLIEFEHQNVAIDSKFPTQSYLEYIESKDDYAKEQNIKKFKTALSIYVKDLQKYISKKHKINYVIMCLPSDSMYIAMLELFKESFVNDALNKNIVIASPTILIPMVKTLQNVVNKEKLSENIEQRIETLLKSYDAANRWAESWNTFCNSFARVAKSVVDFNKKQNTLFNQYKKLETNDKQLIDSVEQNKATLKDVNNELETAISEIKGNNEE